MEIALVNPGRKVKYKRGKTMAKKRRSKRRMTAKQRKYFGKRRVKRARRNVTISAARNPVRRLSRRRKRSMRSYRRNPIRMRGFNPRTFVNQSLMPAGIGAAGALGLDMLMGMLPLPDALKTPTMRPLVRIAGAVGIGMIAGMVTNRKMGEQVGAGALTVVLYDVLKGFVQRTMPTLSLGENDYTSLEYYNPAMITGDVDTNGVGMYVGEDQGVGEYVE